MNTTTDVDQRIAELESEGLNRPQIGAKLRDEGFKTKHGKMISDGWVASRTSFLRYRKKKDHDGFHKRKMRARKEPEMIEIPVAETARPSKVVAIIGTVEEVQSFLRGMG